METEEVASPETPQGRPLIGWCLSTDPNGVNEEMNNVSRKREEQLRQVLVGRKLVWQRQGSQCDRSGVSAGTKAQGQFCTS